MIAYVATPDPLLALIPFALGLLIAWGLLAFASRRDRKGWILSRAPALPVGALSEHDDAWIRGVVDTAEPLRCPWFETECVAYEYTIEKKVTRTTTTNGKTTTQTSWETEHTENRRIAFELVDDGERIEVLLPLAEMHAWQSLDTDYEWLSRRHSARVLRPGKTVSALGVRLAGGPFGPLREVPLIVTFADRARFLKGTARSESWSRAFGFVFAFLGGFGATLILSVGRRGLEPIDWLYAFGGGLLLWAPVWGLSTYNRFVRTRQQLEAAWRQIDVDWSVRDQLLPQLVAVVEGYRDHERELFEAVARLRAGGGASERVDRDAEASEVSRQLLALRERYPELEANTMFSDLHRRLWALEEKLAASRTFYNDVCREWNGLVEGFPSVMLARLLGHQTRSYFRSRLASS